MRLIRDGEKVVGEGVWIWRKREVDFADNIFQLDIYIISVILCLFNDLSRRVGALQTSIIIIITLSPPE